MIEFTISGQLSDYPLLALLPAAESALYEEAEAILAVSQEEYVPVDEAILKGSGYVVPPVREGHTLIVVLGYGGPAQEYAIAVHEHLSKYSPQSWKTAEAAGRPVHFHPEGHGPKYLELPVMHAEPGFGDRVAARIRVKVGG